VLENRVNLHFGGTITGPGNLTIMTGMNWSRGGLMSGSGITTISADAELVGGAMRQQTRTLENFGQVTLDNARWDLSDGARFENANVVSIPGSTIIRSVGPAAFVDNTGRITVSAQNPTQVTFIVGPILVFRNDGQVSVTSGVLSFGGGGFAGARVVVGSGKFKAAAGAEVHFIDTPLTFTAGNDAVNGPSLRGAGWYRFRGEAVTVPNGIVIADNFQLDADDGDATTTLTGAGTFEAHNFLWTCGTMTGTGTTLVGYGDYMEIDTEIATLSGRQFLVIGMVLWDPIAGVLNLNDSAALTINDGLFETSVQLGFIRSNDGFPLPPANPIIVMDGGVFQANPAMFFPGNMTIEVPFSDDGGVVKLYQDTTFLGNFSNTGGLFRTTANAGFSNGFFQSGASAASFFGAGTYTFARAGITPLDAQGGTISLAGGTIQQQPAGHMRCSNTTFDVTGQIVGYWDCTTCTIRLVGDLRVTGTMALDGSAIYLGGHTLNVDLLQNNNLPNQRGRIFLQGGTLNQGDGSFNDGDLTGPGSIGGNMVEGADATLSTGDGTTYGNLVIDGDLIEIDGASLSFLVGPDGSDSLVVVGTAHLAGTVNAVLVTGFSPDPTVPDTFTVLTYCAYEGSFDNGTIDLGNGLAFAVLVGSDTVTLVTELSA
jgi:hypothetical protein